MFLRRRSIAELLAPLEQNRGQVVEPGSESRRAVHDAADRATNCRVTCSSAPRVASDAIRLGLFAGIHGDEPEGVHALIQFLSLLERKPELATGYCLFVYPVCNPTGFEDRTRHARSGKDLNREFWNGSTEPEVKLLQSELLAHSFHGIISLHTDDSSHGFYGFAHGATLTKNLIEPALQAAEQFLPRNGNETIDGFRARNGIIRDSYPGVLSAPAEGAPAPVRDHPGDTAGAAELLEGSGVGGGVADDPDSLSRDDGLRAKPVITTNNTTQRKEDNYASISRRNQHSGANPADQTQPHHQRRARHHCGERASSSTRWAA